MAATRAKKRKNSVELAVFDPTQPPHPSATPEICEEWQGFRGRSPMQQALAELNLSPMTAAVYLKEELDATSVKAAVVDVQEWVTPPDGSDPVLINVKAWTYSKPMPDYPIRQRARQDLMKLWESIPKQNGGGEGDLDGPLVIHIERE